MGYREGTWNLHEQTVGIEAAYIHTPFTPDSSSLRALLASWKMLEASPEHEYQNGSISKLADTPNMVIGCGEYCAS